MGKLPNNTFNMETILHVIASYKKPVTRMQIVKDYPILGDFDIAAKFQAPESKKLIHRKGTTTKRTFQLTNEGADYLKKHDSTVQDLDNIDIKSIKPKRAYKKRKATAPAPAPEPQFTGSTAAVEAINAAAMIVETSNQARELLGQIHTLCANYFEKFENDYADEATGIFAPVINESLHFRELLKQIEQITEPMEKDKGNEPEQRSLIESD